MTQSVELPCLPPLKSPSGWTNPGPAAASCACQQTPQHSRPKPLLSNMHDADHLERSHRMSAQSSRQVWGLYIISEKIFSIQHREIHMTIFVPQRPVVFNYKYKSPVLQLGRRPVHALLSTSRIPGLHTGKHRSQQNPAHYCATYQTFPGFSTTRQENNSELSMEVCSAPCQKPYVQKVCSKK